MRKATVILFAMVMLLSMAFVSCTKEDPSSNEKVETTTQETEKNEVETIGDESIFNAPGEFPIVKDAGSISLSVLVAPEAWLGQFGEDNWMTGYYEEKTGIKIDWMQISREEKDTRMNLMLSSGDDLPDVFMLEINNDVLSSYGNEGIFIPLNEYINEVGVGIKIMEEADPTLLGSITSPDGNIYSLVQRNECYHCDIQNRFWINQVWLDNLGLEMPTTTDEFYDVLVQFRDKDANGNGDPDDEIGIVPQIDFWNGKAVGFLNNAFTFTPDSIGGTELYVDNGVIKSSANQEGWKESLKYLNKLYEDGLLYEQAFTVTSETARQLSAAENGNRIGSFPGGYHGGTCDISADAAAKDEYVALLPLEGPTGLKQSPFYYTSVMACFAITNSCEYPEAAFRWGDSMQILQATDIEFEQNGPEGIVWRRGEEGEVGLDGRDDPTKLVSQILTYGEPHNWHWGQPKPVMNTNETRFSTVSPQGVWDLETELYIARTAYTPYSNQENVIPNYMKTPEEAAEIAEYATLIETIDNYYARFIIGDLDIDSDWDEYIETIEAEGLLRVIEIEQIAYDRYIANSN